MGRITVHVYGVFGVAWNKKEGAPEVTCIVQCGASGYLQTRVSPMAYVVRHGLMGAIWDDVLELNVASGDRCITFSVLDERPTARKDELGRAEVEFDILPDGCWRDWWLPLEQSTVGSSVACRIYTDCGLSAPVDPHDFPPGMRHRVEELRKGPFSIPRKATAHLLRAPTHMTHSVVCLAAFVLCCAYARKKLLKLGGGMSGIASTHSLTISGRMPYAEVTAAVRLRRMASGGISIPRSVDDRVRLNAFEDDMESEQEDDEDSIANLLPRLEEVPLGRSPDNNALLDRVQRKRQLRRELQSRRQEAVMRHGERHSERQRRVWRWEERLEAAREHPENRYHLWVFELQVEVCRGRMDVSTSEMNKLRAKWAQEDRDLDISPLEKSALRGARARRYFKRTPPPEVLDQWSRVPVPLRRMSVATGGDDRILESVVSKIEYQKAREAEKVTQRARQQELIASMGARLDAIETRLGKPGVGADEKARLLEEQHGLLVRIDEEKEVSSGQVHEATPGVEPLATEEVRVLRGARAEIYKRVEQSAEKTLARHRKQLLKLLRLVADAYIAAPICGAVAAALSVASLMSTLVQHRRTEHLAADLFACVGARGRRGAGRRGSIHRAIIAARHKSTEPVTVDAAIDELFSALSIPSRRNEFVAVDEVRDLVRLWMGKGAPLTMCDDVMAPAVRAARRFLPMPDQAGSAGSPLLSLVVERSNSPRKPLVSVPKVRVGDTDERKQKKGKKRPKSPTEVPLAIRVPAGTSPVSSTLGTPPTSGSFNFSKFLGPRLGGGGWFTRPKEQPIVLTASPADKRKTALQRVFAGSLLDTTSITTQWQVSLMGTLNSPKTLDGAGSPSVGSVEGIDAKPLWTNPASVSVQLTKCISRGVFKDLCVALARQKKNELQLPPTGQTVSQDVVRKLLAKDDNARRLSVASHQRWSRLQGMLDESAEELSEARQGNSPGTSVFDKLEELSVLREALLDLDAHRRRERWVSGLSPAEAAALRGVRARDFFKRESSAPRPQSPQVSPLVPGGEGAAEAKPAWGSRTASVMEQARTKYRHLRLLLVHMEELKFQEARYRSGFARVWGQRVEAVLVASRRLSDLMPLPRGRQRPVVVKPPFGGLATLCAPLGDGVRCPALAELSRLAAADRSIQQHSMAGGMDMDASTSLTFTTNTLHCRSCTSPASSPRQFSSISSLKPQHTSLGIGVATLGVSMAAWSPTPMPPPDLDSMTAQVRRDAVFLALHEQMSFQVPYAALTIQRVWFGHLGRRVAAEALAAPLVRLHHHRRMLQHRIDRQYCESADAYRGLCATPPPSPGTETLEPLTAWSPPPLSPHAHTLACDLAVAARETTRRARRAAVCAAAAVVALAAAPPPTPKPPPKRPQRPPARRMRTSPDVIVVPMELLEAAGVKVHDKQFGTPGTPCSTVGSASTSTVPPQRQRRPQTARQRRVLFGETEAGGRRDSIQRADERCVKSFADTAAQKLCMALTDFTKNRKCFAQALPDVVITGGAPSDDDGRSGVERRRKQAKALDERRQSISDAQRQRRLEYLSNILRQPAPPQPRSIFPSGKLPQ
eukprot:TRINITY_DN36047_c0_g1_i1.p1 TRINITY_DN36047_c0_g1~~TRINITY_DN36047_c0_g1_i1.p1  ORF type:complete len:1565 (+),score=456.47 TRINITY_DN36047_c0_g1_i1:45-4739(+)